MKELSPIRRFSVLCLIALVVLGLALGWLASASVERTFSESLAAATGAEARASSSQLDIANHKRTIWFGITAGFSLLYFVLCGVVLDATSRMERRVHEMEDLLFIRVARSLVEALDAKSSWMRGHSDRVGQFSEQVALRMGLAKSEIRNLRLAGLLHDIGKIGTYDYLLEKPAILTQAEFDIVKRHPEAGVKILEGIKQLRDILPMIKHHHERYDGKGYPAGLKGDQIPIGARILHVTDSFEAITDDRPYRPARAYQEAVEEIRRNSGTQFDPNVVEAFFSSITETCQEQSPRA